MSHDTTDQAGAMRTVAAMWHGGQASGLYSYASSGYIHPDALLEVERCQRDLANSEVYNEGDRTVYMPELSALAAHLKSFQMEEEDDDQ